MRYRPEIDGLRAIAILPVLLFHANASLFSGGYVGVDIFFVISGFLITNIIFTEIREKRFSILRFYRRRILRLFPAAFVMMFSVAIAGYFLLLPNHYNDAGKSMVWAALNVSNIYFYLDSGYFAGAAHLKPLLHTWSLAVEEQFYIFFPWIMILASRWRHGFILTLMVVMAASFMACVYYIGIDRDATFYLLPFRAWELGIGALLALNVLPVVRNRYLAETLVWAGLCLILLAIFTYTKQTEFPGIHAVPPCLGALFILWGTTGSNTVGAKLLKLKPMVFVGLISYPLYLWHWPVLVLFQHTQVQPLHAWQAMSAIGLSVLLAYLSYRYVETPFRKGGKTYKLWKVLVCGVCSMALIGALGFGIAIKDGFPNRYSSQVNTILDRFAGFYTEAEACTTIINAERYKTDPKGCRFGSKTADTTVAILGDSHANVFTQLLGDLAKERNLGMINMIGDGCWPVFGLESRDSSGCVGLRHYANQYLKESKKINTLIIASYWVALLSGRHDVNYGVNQKVTFSQISKTRGGDLLSTEQAVPVLREKLLAMTDSLLKQGIKVIIVYPVPEPDYNVPDALALYMARGRNINELYVPYEEYKHRSTLATQVLDSLSKDIVRIYPEKYLCDGNICKVYNGTKSYYYDDNHLSRAGASLMREDFKAALR